MHGCMDVGMYGRMVGMMSECSCMHACTDLRTGICLSVRMHACTSVSSHVCTYVCAYAHMHVYIFTYAHTGLIPSGYDVSASIGPPTVAATLAPAPWHGSLSLYWVSWCFELLYHLLRWSL